MRKRTLTAKGGIALQIQTGTNTEKVTSDLLRLMAVDKSDQVLLGAMKVLRTALTQNAPTTVSDCNFTGPF